MTLGPLMIDLNGCELTAEERELLAHPLVGSVILFSRNYAGPAQLQALVAAIHAVRSPPLLVAVDHEGGRVQRFRDGFTRLPAARLIGRQYDADRQSAVKLAETCGWLMAAELRARGIDFSFAPVLDLDWGLSEVIGDRALHRDPQAVAELAHAYATGMRGAGMSAVAKHFPGHGGVVADSHVASAIDRRPYAELAEDLLPFERLIEAGLPAIMIAHVSFPEVDARPAGFSRWWLKEELRGRLDFRGVIFSDDIDMVGAAVVGGHLQRVTAALAAGCDVVPICNNRPAVVEVIDGLGDHSDPAGQFRLVRMHGRPAPDDSALRGLPRWRDAVAELNRLAAAPGLELDA